MYEYHVTIINIVDGDTVDVDIDLGFGVWIHNKRVRIMGIDTPESRTRDLIEKQFGLAAKKRCEELLPVGSKIVFLSYLDKIGKSLTGKFGRLLGDFVIGDKTCSQIMLEEGHAIVYGDSAESIAATTSINRERLLNEGTVVLDPNFK